MEALSFVGYNIKAEHKKISLKCRSESSGAGWGSSSLFLTRYAERSGQIKTPSDQMSDSAPQEYSASRSR